ncbi:response regulator transcription factor [Oricola cellulosilytica]|uniref:Response regulator transcription factor n=1 Tax=Oricola cellulosilytica TaxID=1429082 RepID=A0A4R0PHG4_9HYPH|nr:response regulator transcription factor [Oricola cellulosilytica]TCD16214.1 response regulator transcription factor [Oricola cellulosilytica]
MIVVVDDRDLVRQGFSGMFQRIGFPVFGVCGKELPAWLDSICSNEMESIEAFLVGHSDSESCPVSSIRQATKLPVISVIEQNSLQDILRHFESGADDVVRKPIHVQEILARVAAIRRRKDTSRTVFEFGALLVHTDGRDPEIGGRSFALPRRERRILEYLASNGDRRATRTQIYNAVYGMFEQDVEECVIESHISKLRKKLRKALGYEVIDSKRFLGYRLDAQAAKAFEAQSDKQPPHTAPGRFGQDLEVTLR